MNKLIYTEPMLDFSVMFTANMGLSDAYKYYCKWSKCTVPYNGTENYALGRFIYWDRSIYNCLIWVRRLNRNDNRSIATLAHECLHCVEHILNAKDIDNEEMRCTLLSTLITKGLNII